MSNTPSSYPIDPLSGTPIIPAAERFPAAQAPASDLSAAEAELVRAFRAQQAAAPAAPAADPVAALGVAPAPLLAGPLPGAMGPGTDGNSLVAAAATVYGRLLEVSKDSITAVEGPEVAQGISRSIAQDAFALWLAENV